jgi:transposase
MNLLKYGVGNDIAKDSFDACVSAIDAQQTTTIIASRKFANNPKGFAEYILWVRKNAPIKIPIVFIMEATGVYYEQLAWFLFQEKCSVAVVLPNKAKKYKESLGLKSKNDKIDAKGLARMICEQHIKLWQPLSASAYKMRLVTRQIERVSILVATMKAQLLTLHHGMHRDKEIEQMISKQIAMLQKQKDKLEKRIEDIVHQDPLLKRKFENILQIRGLGLQSLAVVIAETNAFTLFENQAQLVSYAGYDVIESQSGKHAGKTKLSKKGNAHIRRILHFPALNVVKLQQTPFKQLYGRLYERSRIKMKAYTAIQKKLLILIYTLWKNDQVFNPDYISGKQEQEPSFALVPQEA